MAEIAKTSAQEPDGGEVKLPIYMDNHATTRTDPRVVDEMLPYFSQSFGNAASCSHEFGWTAERAVEQARQRVAHLIGANAKEIVFTSGATESDNLAIKGVAAMCRDRNRRKGAHIITQVTEHKAVLDACKRLEHDGFRVTYLPVRKDGRIDLDDLRRGIDERTILVSIMAANNEIGVLQPVSEIGALCRDRGVFFHADAVQAVGKVPFNVIDDNVDLASISAHKMYGPKGVGALYVRSEVQLEAQIDGGGHQRGKACAIAGEEIADEAQRMAALRDRLRDAILGELDEVHVNGSMEHRLPGNLNLSFAYVDGESLLMGMNDVAVSSGSACTSGTPEPSYVLQALGVDDELAYSSIRFGLGRFNTSAEIDYVARRVVETVQRLRELSPQYEAVKNGSTRR
jgi:cysteine desulfurase